MQGATGIGRRQGYKLWLMAAGISMLASCTSIRLVGDYDKQIDDGVTALQRNTEAHFVKLEAVPGARAASYRANETFYGETKVAVSSLRIRADATERNSLTVRMLDRLQNNFDRLERFHQEGLTKDQLPLLRGGFNSQFTAILTFELAKRRGGTPDEAKALAPATPAGKDDGAKK